MLFESVAGCFDFILLPFQFVKLYIQLQGHDGSFLSPCSCAKRNLNFPGFASASNESVFYLFASITRLSVQSSFAEACLPQVAVFPERGNDESVIGGNEWRIRTAWWRGGEDGWMNQVHMDSVA